ncbi:MAG: suppressor of fused domain protein [Oscillospiraceae bacterium]|nr:suppressor of fused domain protein [Oscillospiraceae bacterium]
MDEKDIFKMFDYIAEDVKNNFDDSAVGGEYILPADSLNTEHISDFICENFGVINPDVFHELISEIIHVDVFCVPPSEEKPYHVLMTSGMSDLPMTFRENISKEYTENNCRCELMMLLPKEWNIKSTASTLWNWPINVLKMTARYPHGDKTWIGEWHDIQFTDPAEPFAENTELCALLFVRPTDEKLRFITGENGMKINVYIAVPIYKEELEFKLEHGAEALIEKLFGTEAVSDSNFVVDIDRKNVCI